MQPQSLAAHAHPLTRAQYDRMVELGVLDRTDRVELLYGVIVEMSPQGSRHAYAIRRLTALLVSALSDRAEVQVQLPLAMPHESEPEPDLSVVPAGTYLDDHPDRAHLVVEVCASSLQHDRMHKLPLYADGGVDEAWLVNLVDGVVEVHTDPVEGRYTTTRVVAPGGSISLVAFPDVVVQAEAFLPPA